ncbi:MAG: TVP38/TMEM64 family protein [Betaproteobacteria bacterium]|nr:TVP38/TMEM64 family protein [Betaproteobacteria bacterium]
MDDHYGSNSRPPNRWRFALAVLGALAAGAILWWLSPRAQAFGFDRTVRGTEELIRSWGAWGVAGSIGLMVAHSFLPFPAEIVALANGMVYGPVWGALITWTGAMLGAASAFGLARLLGRPVLRGLLPRESVKRMAEWSRERGGRALLVSRLIPVIAFNLINYAAALTEISWWTFLWATGLGILPFTIVLAVLGENVLAMPLWGWLVLGAAALAAWLLPGKRRARALGAGQAPTERDS